MQSQRFLFGLTLINFALFAYQGARFHTANAADADSVLRGSGIEIVDESGRRRAELKIEPADSAFEMPDGTTGYPETVIFRLITADGKPRVKLTTSEEGSGLMLLGATDTTHTILEADRDETSLRLRNDEATQRLLEAR